MEATFTKQHEDTKSCRRFTEVVEDGAQPVVGTLYVKLDALKANKLTNVESLTVTIAKSA